MSTYVTLSRSEFDKLSKTAQDEIRRLLQAVDDDADFEPGRAVDIDLASLGTIVARVNGRGRLMLEEFAKSSGQVSVGRLIEVTGAEDRPALVATRLGITAHTRK